MALMRRRTDNLIAHIILLAYLVIAMFPIVVGGYQLIQRAQSDF